MFLTRREIQRGMALACQTYVDGDAVVEVPLESRIGGVPQLASEDAVRYGRVTSGVGQTGRFCLPTAVQQGSSAAAAAHDRGQPAGRGAPLP